MNIGVSTGCLYPMLTEDSLSSLSELGFTTFEIFLNTFSEIENAYIKKLCGILERSGARVVSIHPFTSSYESFLLFSNYERRFLDGMGFYEKYFRTAQLLGADKVILHGLNTTYRATIPDEEYFRRFAALQSRASEYGVTLLQENVNKFRSGSNEFLKAMCKLIPNEAAFVCDTKQSFRCGTTPLETARAMGSCLEHIHISGNTPDGACVLPLRSESWTDELFEYLSISGYRGDMIIEVYRSSFESTEQLIESKKFLEQKAAEYNL